MTCPRCDGSRWVCEAHCERPWEPDNLRLWRGRRQIGTVPLLADYPFRISVIVSCNL
jgi:hypothetical protein